jgi:hypothetical protein
MFDIVEAAQYPKHIRPGLCGAGQRLEHWFIVDKVMRQLAFGVDEVAAAL